MKMVFRIEHQMAPTYMSQDIEYAGETHATDFTLQKLASEQISDNQDSVLLGTVNVQRPAEWHKIREWDKPIQETFSETCGRYFSESK